MACAVTARAPARRRPPVPSAHATRCHTSRASNVLMIAGSSSTTASIAYRPGPAKTDASCAIFVSATRMPSISTSFIDHGRSRSTQRIAVAHPRGRGRAPHRDQHDEQQRHVAGRRDDRAERDDERGRLVAGVPHRERAARKRRRGLATGDREAHQRGRVRDGERDRGGDRQRERRVERVGGLHGERLAAADAARLAARGQRRETLQQIAAPAGDALHDGRTPRDQARSDTRSPSNPDGRKTSTAISTRNANTSW